MGIKSVDCNNFQCVHIDGILCKIGNVKCTFSECIGFYLQCSNCGNKNCVNSVKALPKADTKEEKKEITPYAYVDGSFKDGVYGYGGFIVDEDGVRHLLQGNGSDEEYVSMRNVAGELQGAIAAIEFAKSHNFKSLIIYYDYTGIEYWATGKWNANKKGTIEYKNLAANCPVNLTFKKIKGHSGVAGNELADRLAKQAVGIN